MNTELNPGNAAALAKYAALAGHTSTEFLNQYLEENMAALFANPRAGDLQSDLAISSIVPGLMRSGSLPGSKIE